MQKTLVIKFGGEIVENENDLNNLLDSVKQLYLQNNIILVHGGGPLATSLSKRLGVVPNKIGGRRVTDKETLEIIKMTLPGIVNSNILAMMKSKKLPGVSLSGITLFTAKKRPPRLISGAGDKKIDLGFVGDIIDVNQNILNTLFAAKLIPVISPLCADEQGVCLNINADTVATSLAHKIKADQLVLITKIGGVFKDIKNPQSKIDKLNITQAKQAIADGIIQGGMIPKIEESFKLLEKQLNWVHIVGTAKPETLLNEINNPGSEGTAICK